MNVAESQYFYYQHGLENQGIFLGRYEKHSSEARVPQNCRAVYSINSQPNTQDVLSGYISNERSTPDF